MDHTRVQISDRDMRLVGTWPDRPSPDHLASIALAGDALWIVAPYGDTLYEVQVSFVRR